jgi:polysaccharide export outer membrane protein
MGQVLSSAENDYILTPGDVIEITIFREPDLTTRSAIARDGTVQLPLIQEVTLGGISVREAREKLRKLYAGGFLVNPQVYLNVTQFAVRKFTIMGQVARPGSYLLEGGQTIELLEAVGMAGGFTRIADRGRVIVKRRVNGEIETFKVNARRMADGKIEPLMILPGDIITVGESWF